MNAIRKRLSFYLVDSKAASIVNHLLLIFIWLLLWRLAVYMEYAPHASIWFPSAGLTLSVFILFGRKVFASIVIACVLSTFWEDAIFQYERTFAEILINGFTFALLHTGIYGLGAKYLRQLLVNIDHKNLYKIIIHFLFTVCITSLLMSLSGIFLLYDGATLATLQDTLLAWWIGDMTGALVLTPMFIGVINRINPKIGVLTELKYTPSHQSLSSFIIKLLISTLYLIAITALSNYYQSAEIACFVFFLSLPQMWIVHTETAFRATVGLAVLSFSSAGLVAIFGMDTYAYIYQFSVNVTACTTYFSMGVPALVAYNKSLSEKTKIDFLTKALSREQFYYLAEQTIRLSKRNREPVSLLIFDVDNFKDVNDKYGHTVGDEVLFEVARLVKTSLRSSDIFGRFGGDEFIILLPNTSVDNAYQVAEQLRRKIDSFQFSSQQLSLSCSFGVAEINSEDQLQDAFEKADASLLAAKKKGRNATHSH